MKSNYNPNNQNVLITGGSSGIGYYLCQEFLNNNFNVFCLSRREPQIKNLIYLKCDITNKEELLTAITKIQNEYSDINVFINNAGIGIFKPFEQFDDDEYSKTIRTNLDPYYYITKQILKPMITMKSGIIANISSISAIKPFQNATIYSASKAATLALSRSLRLEVGKYNIKVIDFLPGATETEIWSENVVKQFQSVMMKPNFVADYIFSTIIQCMNSNMNIEEVIIRPVTGDI